MSGAEIQKIFSNVEILVGVNRVLLKEFEDAAHENNENVMSQIANSFKRLVCENFVKRRFYEVSSSANRIDIAS